MNVFNKNDPTAIGKGKLVEEVFGEGWEGKGAQSTMKARRR
jgi:alpha-mannosidase